jgi:hypothetical protein
MTRENLVQILGAAIILGTIIVFIAALIYLSNHGV